jgi:hypothetical protein
VTLFRRLLTPRSHRGVEVTGDRVVVLKGESEIADGIDLFGLARRGVVAQVVVHGREGSTEVCRQPAHPVATEYRLVIPAGADLEMCNEIDRDGARLQEGGHEGGWLSVAGCWIGHSPSLVDHDRPIDRSGRDRRLDPVSR